MTIDNRQADPVIFEPDGHAAFVSLVKKIDLVDTFHNKSKPRTITPAYPDAVTSDSTLSICDKRDLLANA